MGDNMLTIRIKHRKVKIFNLLLVLAVLLLFFCLIIKLVLLLPIFNKKYSYNIVGENYKIKSNIIFKKGLLGCNVRENIIINSRDKDLYNFIKKDYMKDGYIFKNKKLIFDYKSKKKCDKLQNNYKKVFENNNFKLLGKEKESVLFDNDFKDPYVNNKKNKVKVSTNLNTKEIGKYYKVYYIETDNIKNKLYRIISIVDNEKPVIELKGEEKVELSFNESYKEPGYSAYDNYDGDITKKVKVNNDVDIKKAGTYFITYTVKDTSLNSFSIKREVIVKEGKKDNTEVNKKEPKIEVKDGLTYVDGILIVNKRYSVPKEYNPGVNEEAEKALNSMQQDAKNVGFELPLLSGFRSYQRQTELYNSYVKKHGEEKANTFSAKPGYSEHQTGLAFDIGQLEYSFGNTPSGKWLAENAHKYGFIIRYLKGKEDITGYVYEPWHVRYLGVDIATKVKESGLSLEEYLGIN